MSALEKLLVSAVAVPAQTDETYKVTSNQCSWCAHQFSLHIVKLIAALEKGDKAAFVDLYTQCVAAGTALRARHKSVTWGENLDDDTMIAHTKRISAAVGGASDASGSASAAAGGSGASSEPSATPATAADKAGLSESAAALVDIQPSPDAACNAVVLHDPRITVRNEEQGAELLAMLDPVLASTFYSITRHPRASEEELRKAVHDLPPLGFIIFERYGLTLCITRTNSASPDDSTAYLITDSHCHEAGTTNFDKTWEHVLMDHGGFAAITWMTGRAVPSA